MTKATVLEAGSLGHILQATPIWPNSAGQRKTALDIDVGLFG